jgi:hypothetical protein
MPSGSRVRDAILDGDLFAHRHEVDEDLGVSVALEDRPARLELGTKLGRVRQVSVVADRQRAARIVDRDRLSVLDVGAARGGVADVADGDAAGELRQLILGERILHEPHRPMRVQVLVVTRDDPGRFLAAMLERVHSQVRDVGRLGMPEDPEDSALIAEVIVFQHLRALPLRHLRRWRIEDDQAALWIEHRAPAS